MTQADMQMPKARDCEIGLASGERRHRKEDARVLVLLHLSSTGSEKGLPMFGYE